MTDAASLFAAQKAAAMAQPAVPPLSGRRAALARLAGALDRHRPALLAAMAADFGKPAAETDLLEFMPLMQEIGHARRHLRRWMRPRRVAPSISMFGTSARLVPQPRGLALIIAPWNYPLLLAIGPLVSALAAGCRVILKPSELTPATSAAVAALLADAFAPDLVAVAQGGPEVAEALLAQPFDHIFFTGSTAVGRKVMAAAARTLATVTLELGGKSPVIVGPGADIERAARSLIWGKFANGGQTCVAPDHIHVHRSIAEGFQAALLRQLAGLYGPDEAARAASPDLARIVNDRHFARLAGLIEGALAGGARLLAGGGRDAARRYIAPTILTGVTPDMGLMQEEIFGPLLPVLTYDDLEDVIGAINAGPRPLALYVYDRSRAFADRISAATVSGGVGVNLSVVQFAHPNLPFGGIGASGQGAAHGQAGFLAFSHLKPVLRDRYSLLPLLFPPYGARMRAMVRALTRLVR